MGEGTAMRDNTKKINVEEAAESGAEAKNKGGVTAEEAGERDIELV